MATAQGGIVHHRQLGAGHCRLADTDGELGADGPRGLGMVAGDHLHADAGTVAFVHRDDGFLARRVDDADQRQQGVTGFDIGEGQLVVRRRAALAGQRQQAALGHSVGRHAPPVVAVDRLVAGVPGGLPHFQDALGRALTKIQGAPSLSWW